MSEEESNVSEFSILKILSVVVFIITIVILVVIKLVNPDLSLWKIILIGFIFLILVIILYFSRELYDYFTERDSKKGKSLPDPITFAEARELAKKILGDKEFGNEVSEILDEGIEEHGKSGNSQSIYFLHCRGKFSDYNINKNYFIAINMHYPNIRRRILINPGISTMGYAKKLLAKDPEHAPDTEETVSENVLTGTKVVQKKVINKKDDKSNDKKKESDI